jgi:uncharacterized protein YigE (DUF2233 family)
VTHRRRRGARLLAALGLLAGLQLAQAATLVYRVEDTGRLHLFLTDARGQPLRTLAGAAALAQASGRQLVFAMNAGIYEPDLRPTGLAVEAGRVLAPLNTRQAAGNFYAPPNGVFYVTASGAAIARTTAYAASPPAGVRLATQSGPILLQDGAMPAPAVRAEPGPTARRLKRNAVCADGGVATLVMVDEPVTLHELARLLRDEVGCRNALYLDGAISQAFDARSGRHDEGVPLGPIIGVVDQAQPATIE